LEGNNVKKILIVLLLVGLITSTASVASAKKKVGGEDKLVEMGFTSYEITQMSERKKKVLLETYEKFNGTSRVLPSEDGGITTMSEDFVDIVMLAGNVGSCQTGYICKGITVIGDINVPFWGNNSYITQPVIGAAWADNWSYFDYEAEVKWGDYFGVDQADDMTLVDATPEAGLGFKHPNLGHGVREATMEMHITIRRQTSAGTGTTDIAAKTGYTGSTTIVGATISGSPSITFTPSSKIYQVADTSTVYY
jgi:hypothetical protein